jgi:hypothetical protein
MLAQVLQIFLGKDHLVQNLSSLHKIGWRPAKKFAVFFDMRILYLYFYATKQMPTLLLPANTQENNQMASLLKRF